MSKLAKALTAAAGNAAGESLYVEDVFNTTVYYDTYASSTTNGIDLAGEGGLVWIKKRASVANHFLYDTERGIEKALLSNSSGVEFTATNSLTSFNSDGFSLGTYSNTNSGVAWTFRKAEKFFDVVTWTGDGTSSRTIQHNLGSTPACIIVKCTSLTENWGVYHKDLPAGNVLLLSSTNAAGSAPNWFTTNSPTSSDFYVGSDAGTNWNGATYVAYLFASDAGGFGDDGSESIIKCGTWDATGTNEVDLGFEPQWILIKNADAGYNWGIFDTMRGWTADGNMQVLAPNTSSAETSESAVIKVTSTGFTWLPSVSGNTYIYIAIRRPMKTPESGTEVFNAIAYTGDGTNSKTFTGAGFPTDLVINNDRARVNTRPWFDRLRGGTQRLTSTATSAEGVVDYGVQSLATMDGYIGGTGDANTFGFNASGITYANYYFKRATGFFDVVAYTGNGITNHDISHNLAVVPEIIIYKSRSDGTREWVVYHKDLNTEWASNDYYLKLNSSNGVAGSNFWDDAPTATTFQASGDASDNEINGSGQTYIAYLFATLAGVSKVGSYTGTAGTLQINCGFSSGARFVLIKRTDATGDWYVWDSARGIVSGNDPYLLLNSTAAEVTSTDYIDPLASGFTVTSSATGTINVFNGSYIFLAIA